MTDNTDLVTALRSRLEYTERELVEAQSALWRITPNTHTVSCELNNFAPPDSFEGPGETYRDAFERVSRSLRECVKAHARVEEKLERINSLDDKLVEAGRAAIATRARSKGCGTPCPTPFKCSCKHDAFAVLITLAIILEDYPS